MSYILDALRKADSDRERGAVPGIHTQSAPAGGDSAMPRRNAMVWAAIVVSALVVAALAWWLFGRDGEVARPATAAPPVVAATQPAAVPPPVTPAAPAPPVASITAAPVPAEPTAPTPAAPALAAPPPIAKPPHTGVAALRPAPPQRAPAIVAPPSSAAPASIEPRIHALSELPEAIRRELPQLTVGGSIYSDNAANRFLIINGQIFHEGDKLAPDLWLEQIRLKAAVLRYKDYRYTMRF